MRRRANYHQQQFKFVVCLRSQREREREREIEGELNGIIEKRVVFMIVEIVQVFPRMRFIFRKKIEIEENLNFRFQINQREKNKA